MVDILNVAKAISYLRKRAGYTQKELAERLGVSDKAVSKWERGLGLPDVSLLGKLSVLLDTDTDSLLAGDVIHHDKGWHGLLVLDDNRYGIGPDTIIYDKPLIYYLLSYFLLVGINDIKIICSDKAKQFIEREFCCKHQFHLKLSFGKAVFEASADKDFMFCDNLMVVFGRSIIYGVDMTRFLQKAMADKTRLTLLTLPRGIKDASSYIRFDANKKIVPLNHNDQLKTQYNYCDIPVLFCPKTVFLKTIEPSENPYDISWVFRNQDVYIEALDRGFVEILVQDWDDVEEAASFVRIVQKHCGMIIYCIEEVAWRRGCIDIEGMQERAAEKAGTRYAEYILQLI